MLRLFQHRRYILTNAVHDLRHRYAATGIGFAWNVIHPLSLILVYTMIFATIMPARFRGGSGTEIPFILYLCSGLLPWLAFSDSLNTAANAFIDNASYLKKITIPEEIFVAKAAATGTLMLGIYLGLLAVIGPAMGLMPTWHWLVLPAAGAMLMSFAYGLGLVLSVMNTFFRDIAQFLQVVLQLWFWLTPIAYVDTILPAWVRALLFANPMYYFTAALRDLYLHARLPGLEIWLGMAVLATVPVAAGYLVLARLRSEIRDVI